MNHRVRHALVFHISTAHINHKYYLNRDRVILLFKTSRLHGASHHVKQHQLSLVSYHGTLDHLQLSFNEVERPCKIWCLPPSPCQGRKDHPIIFFFVLKTLPEALRHIIHFKDRGGDVSSGPAPRDSLYPALYNNLQGLVVCIVLCVALSWFSTPSLELCTVITTYTTKKGSLVSPSLRGPCTSLHSELKGLGALQHPFIAILLFRCPVKCTQCAGVRSSYYRF